MTDHLSQLRASLSGQYTVERELGGGGMSRVYVAEETRLHRKVVIKVVSPELAQGLSIERFEREIQLAASLSQANIVPVLSAGDTDGLPYFTMPFVDGESLRHKLSHGPLAIADVVSIMRDVSRALSYAHKHGIVHRDIKPDNVLLSAGAAVVTDFGIAKALAASQRPEGNRPKDLSPTGLTRTGTSIGTAAYMAPEQAAGDPAVDHRADIYSLGCMAYELLAGKPPFPRESLQRVIAAQFTETPRSISELRADTPPALAAIVMQCLEKDPARRPAGADEVLQQLHRVPAGETGAPAPSNRRLRNIRYGIAGTVVVLAGLAFILAKRPGAGAGASAIRSLAVLPIENVGGDSTKEYLADGMTGELAGNLRQTPGLAVVGDLSTSRFKRSQLAPSEIASQLHVGMLLSGKLQSQGSSIRLQMQLNDAAGKLLWSEKFDRQMKDNFALQDEVAGAIASEMRLVLSPASTTVARAGRTENPEAHDLYMRAVFEKNKLSEQGLARAVTYFKQALQLDSTYARAWAGLAFAYDMQADAYLPSHPLHLLAKAAAEHAVRSDSMLAEAHVLYGFEVAAATWDFDKGLAEMRRGVALDPNAPDALFMFSLFLGASGHQAEGVQIADQLIRVDPLSATASMARAADFAFGRRWAEALRQDSVTKRLDATVVYADAWDGSALRELGHLEESVAAYRAFQALTGQPSFGLAVTYGRMGKRDEALSIIHALEERRRHQWVDPTSIASAYAAVGDKDRAMAWLDTAFQDKAFTLRFDDFYWLDGLRDDPRYIALRKKVLATTFSE